MKGSLRRRAEIRERARGAQEALDHLAGKHLNTPCRHNGTGDFDSFVGLLTGRTGPRLMLDLLDDLEAEGPKT